MSDLEGEENVYYPPKEIIPGVLATWGAGDIGWDDKRKSYRFLKRNWNGEVWHVVDLRNDMIDGSGNPLWLYKRKINEAVSCISKYGRVMICCLAGISRSNSIAVGVLMERYNMDYIDAIGEVKDKVNYAMMDNAHLNALKGLYPSKFSFNLGNKRDGL